MHFNKQLHGQFKQTCSESHFLETVESRVSWAVDPTAWRLQLTWVSVQISRASSEEQCEYGQQLQTGL